METTKVCFKCELEKPLSEFYEHPIYTILGGSNVRFGYPKGK